MIDGITDIAAFAAAVQSIRPGAEWSIRAGALVWLDAVQPEPTAAEIDAAILASLKQGRIAEAWAAGEARLAAAAVAVPIGGAATPFGCDPVTRENIIGINSLIDKERGGLLPPGTIPNPRPWTPKGASAPVAVTHAEFALIGAMLAGAKEQHFTAYAIHKQAILALTTPAAVAAYDLNSGWP